MRGLASVSPVRVITVVLLAVALALAGNLATNTVQVSAPWWPWAVWCAVAVLVIATIGIELARRRDGVIVTRVSKLTDPIRLGVHPAAVLEGTRVPPFVQRDRLPDLENALATDGFVLVVGDSTAGKTRLAYESMRISLPRYLCIRPETPDALPAAVALAKRKRRSVLWLDDLERYLGATTSLPRLVLATIRTQERDELCHRHDADRSSGERQAARAGRELLNLVTTEIRLDRMWSEVEIALARSTPDERITQALASVDKHGVAESIAAGPQLLQSWRDARDVRGAALVSAAVDARRAGHHRPLPPDLLQMLHVVYLPAASRPGTWEAALAWATRPLHATSSLLEPAGGGYLAFDYLVDTSTSPIPEATWRTLIAEAPPADLAKLAWRASFHGQVDQVERAFDRVLGAGLHMVALEVAMCLGDAGRADRATELLTLLADRATSPEDRLVIRDRLAWELGQKYWDTGDPVRALEVARQVAEDSASLFGDDHPDTLGARCTVARQLGASGHPDEALRLAVAVAEQAAVVLGPDHDTTLDGRFEVALWTWKVHGDAAGAEKFLALLQQMGSMPANLRSFVDCLWNLGCALLGTGDAVAAVGILTEAAEKAELTFGPQHRRTLQVRLAHLEAVGEAGDRDRALSLARQVFSDSTTSLRADDPVTEDARAAVLEWS